MDDDFAEAPEVQLSVDGSGMSVSAAEAVAFADSLELFAARVRGLARLAVAQ
ncbi:hypothetical protein [Streptomyces sp. PT12]|uniref:hypothetical protein n=1 Tax=Streptomyces sp. PT12 TaxID=1510197 RepID=UPI001C67154F|nr:hypothetical protein [Streptomyces sp. PT12]